MAWEQNNPRITPPHIADPEQGEADLWEPGIEADDEATEEPSPEVSQSEPRWDQLAKDSYRDSTSYVDSNYRRNWEDSLRAFNNQHPMDSKYNMDVFRKRSHSFVPKTRAVIRKNEAAAAAAFFSNLDTVSIQASNQSDDQQRLSADVMFQIVQYRLTHTIPWFQVLIGGLQDAQAQGACIGHIHWRFVANGKGAELKVLEDKPCMDLVPIENIRFHPASHWTDPLHTSPYLIHLIPMFVGDVKERMRQPDPKGRTWIALSDAILKRYTDDANDSTRAARLGVSEDPTNARSRVGDYDVVWIHRHIHKYRGVDYEWYTLASEVRLTDPEPLANTVFHGRRPYEMGRAILETHKSLPSSVPQLVKGPQEDINNTRNQRNDNVMFVLNKRYMVKRGANVDLQGLIRNVPGGITQVNSMEDVKEMEWPDVTQSSYLEEDRSVGVFDELIGNFNPLQVSQQRTPRESERTMLAVQSPSNLLTEYMLKTYVETFVLPVIRQLVLLEQHYETDQAVLAVAGDKAKVRQKYGIDRVTDELLEAELTTNINVGMGATDPVMKLQRFLLGLNSLQRFAMKPPPGINLNEVYKEVFALSGYQDGTRFTLSQDPEKMKLQQQLVQAMKLLQKLQMEKNNRHEANVVRLQTSRETNRSRERIAGMKTAADTLKQGRQHRQDRVLKLAGHMMDLDRAQRQQADIDLEESAPPLTLEAGNGA